MDADVNYNQALDYLYSFVDYSLKHTSELVKADFNLDRMRDLMALMGNPELKYPILHVAGTKGKGSTSAFMATALKKAGYKTGLYTSPHLQDYSERIQINNQPISHQELADLVDEIKPLVEKVPFITTFELTTALGFLYFAKQKVDVAVIEVGLGGRLDATNIVTPLVSVITSLSFDHTAVLGNTLPLIAGEKAGIIKPGVPVVCSPQKEEALDVIKMKAKKKEVPLILVGKDWLFEKCSSSLDGQEMKIWKKGEEKIKFHIQLLGSYQVQNAVTAFAALQEAHNAGLKITNSDIKKGFAETFWPGRFEILQREPVVILDSAHNQDSAQKLYQAMDEYFPGRRIILIFGASEDKDVKAMFNEWKNKLSLVITTRAEHPRAIDPAQLAAMAGEIGIQNKVVSPVGDAFDDALRIASQEGDIVLSAGSMFVTAEVRTAWQKKIKIT